MAAQAGALLHFELYTEEDDVNYIRWKWISKKEAHRVLRGIDGRLLRRSDLHDALWMDWARPEEGTTSVREFVLNWDDSTQSSTVGGREIPLTIDTMREYFLLPEGLNPRGPRGITMSCRIGCLSGPGPPRRGAFLYILKNKVGPADEDENLDWATYFKEKVREEIRACKKQMQASGKRKVRPTCIGIVVLHILRTCGIVDDEDIVLSDSDNGSPSSPDRGEPADNEPLTGFGSPMVPYPASKDDEEGAIEGTIKGLTSLGAADLTKIAKGKRPVLHRSSSESEEIRFARPDRVKRKVAATEDEAGGPVSQ
ncbi:hypothetical protein R1sor_020644 [Riccia sorocarpa]|uniref:Uncharacterized protein n=1 Tax=Riccia sorocarpa TaxID=122646 RepID=A0ABD3GET5_9MARC